VNASDKLDGTFSGRLVLAALVLAMALAGCNSVDELGSPGAGFTGPTNTPIPAFANLKNGSEEDFILNVGRRVYFKAGSAELDDTARMTLDRQAAWLIEHPRWYVKLQGHADDPGNNGSLSTRRAENAMAYLTSKGVSADRMWAKGYGRERLVRDCPELVCQSQNRRVVSNLREKLEDHVIAQRSGLTGQ
jgi:peptidoglycan-associated lipoprotein